MPIDPKQIYLPEVQDYVERTFRHMADQKGLNFQIVMDPLVPRTMFTDVNRLQQILKNLLSNAFKFTAQGHVAMTLRRVTEGWSMDHPVLRLGQNAVAIAVSDTGIGIEPDFLPAIFDRFSQTDMSRTRRHGGLGLGLTLVKQLVEMHGGTIEAASDGAGSSTPMTSICAVITASSASATNPPPSRTMRAAFDAAAITDGSSTAIGTSTSWPLTRKLRPTPNGSAYTPTAFSTMRSAAAVSRPPKSRTANSSCDRSAAMRRMRRRSSMGRR